MKITHHSTHDLFSRLHGMIAQTRLLSNDLDSPERDYGFDMGVAAAADALDALRRDMGDIIREAERFACVNAGAEEWPADMPEALLFVPIEPIGAVPVDLVSMVGARVRGVLKVTSVALRQPELYVYSSDVANALSAVQGMLAELQAALGKVRLDPDDFEGTIYQPGMGPSSQWPGEATA